MDSTLKWICAALLVALLVATIRLFRQERVPTIVVPTEGAAGDCECKYIRCTVICKPLKYCQARIGHHDDSLCRRGMPEQEIKVRPPSTQAD